MARDWIKLHKGLRTNPKYLRLTPAQRSGVTALYIEADSFNGEFETEDQLRFVMREDYRYVPAIRAVGLLDGLKVYKGAEKQSIADPTAAERKRRERAGHTVTPEPVTQKSQRDNRDQEEKREEEKREDETSVGSGVSDETDEGPTFRPELVVGQVIAYAHKQGWPVPSSEQAALKRYLLKNPSVLAQDVILVWERAAEKRPIENPWALIYSRVGKNPDNCTLAEDAARRRIDAAELARHKALREEERAYSAANA